MADFIPINELEIALQSARAGQLPMRDFLRAFVDSDLAVPSGSEIMADGSGFQPLLFDKEQVKMVACFTAMERVGSFAEMTPYCLKIKGKEFLHRVPSGYGLVINPSLSVGFDITPDGLLRIVREFT